MLRKLFIAIIRIYQYTLSPLLGSSKCQFEPSCSHYTVQAIETWGLSRGLWMGIKRIGRCHPWGGHGIDPVPRKSLPEQHKDYASQTPT